MFYKYSVKCYDKEEYIDSGSKESRKYFLNLGGNTDVIFALG